jgi:arginine/lysine/ornithine decarboxylase
LKYKEENIYPFHTPGHKGGRGMESLLRNELGESVKVDVSLMSELDDIHEPETYIKEAQDLAAQTAQYMT